MLVWLRPRPIGILSIEPLRQAGSLTAETGWKPIFQQIANAQHPANIVA